MKESLIICPRCGSNACSEVSNDKLTVWNCFGCGFTSNSTLTDENIKTTEEVLPELYKALKQKIDKYHWYPNTVILDDKSMVFAEGNSTEDWKWSAVQSKDGKADMTTKKEYPEREFMDALEYIGYFNQK
jgi:ribosomal protein L37AE/L43A